LANRSNPLETLHLEKDLAARSANGVLIAMGGQAASTLLQIVNLVVLARLLDASDFGIYALGMVLVGFAGIFSNLGLSSASIQIKELTQNTASGLFLINLALGMAVMLVCFIGAPVFVWFLGEAQVFWAVVGLAAIVPVSAASVQFEAVLARGMRWREMQVVNLGSQSIGLLIGVLGALSGFTFMALVAANGATALSRFLFAFLFSNWRPSRGVNWTECVPAIRFGLHQTGFTVCNFIHRQADVFLIGRIWGATEAGFYNRAYQLMAMPLNAVSGPLTQVFVPTLSRLQEDPSRWARAFLRATIASTLIGCAASILLVVNSVALVRLVLGGGWTGTADLFSWLSMSMIFTFPMGAASWAFISRGRSKALFHWGLVSTALTVSAFFVAAPFGAVAVAKAYALSVTLLTPICFSMALYGSQLKTSDAMLEIAPLWVASVATIFALSNLSINSGSNVIDIAIRSSLALIMYALIVMPFAVLRSSYRQLGLQVLRHTSSIINKALVRK